MQLNTIREQICSSLQMFLLLHPLWKLWISCNAETESQCRHCTATCCKSRGHSGSEVKPVNKTECDVSHSCVLLPQLCPSRSQSFQRSPTGTFRRRSLSLCSQRGRNWPGRPRPPRPSPPPAPPTTSLSQRPTGAYSEPAGLRLTRIWQEIKKYLPSHVICKILLDYSMLATCCYEYFNIVLHKNFFKKLKEVRKVHIGAKD